MIYVIRFKFIATSFVCTHTVYAMYVCVSVCVCETLSLWNYRVVRCAPHVTTDVVPLLAVVVAVAVLAAK